MVNIKKSYFPWIKLLVVAIIIVIIATIILMLFQSIRTTAMDSRRMSDIRQLMLALELYYNDHLEYPENGAINRIAKLPKAISPYLNEIPEDPGDIVLACQPQGYRWLGNIGQSHKYCLWACLEEGTFFVASPKGTNLLDKTPLNLDCY